MHINDSSTTRTWLQPSRKVGWLATVMGALFFLGVGLFTLVVAPFTRRLAETVQFGQVARKVAMFHFLSQTSRLQRGYIMENEGGA